MKKFLKEGMITLTMVVMSFTASADSSLTSKYQLEDEILAKLDKINRITERLDRKIKGMNKRELRKLNIKLADAIELMKSGRRGGPGIGPIRPIRPIDPRPIGPIRPIRPRTMLISGSIENTPYSLDVIDSMDLASQCMAQNLGGRGNVDEFTMSVNFSPIERATTSGWWKGNGELCAVLATRAVGMGLPVGKPTMFSTIGKIERTSFEFHAHSLRDLMNQCVDFYNDNRFGNVDEMMIFNGETIRKKTTSGWWRNSHEVCNVLIQELR